MTKQKTFEEEEKTSERIRKLEKQKRDRKSQELEYRKNNKGLSMKAEDVSPNRLDKAKYEINRFKGLSGKDISICMFLNGKLI